ncbi:glycosyltransferase [Streptomyces sp. NBC_01089]|uniref:glycosyltransferase n=1 Tax=Streptomyces sp. NBC_01089 TaxID=2903747 RepID=UPI00386BC722|nr:glycosyltransferase [Streptomyces sp. NBC_01089]
MSVHSQSTAPYEAATPAFAPAHPPEFPQHVVTAVLVTHDGARWLPDALAGLLGQERPVQNVVAADTGSADASASLVTEALGGERVLHLARRTGFGAAVDEAARTAGVLTPEELPYLKRPSGWDPVSRSWRDDAYDMPELPHGEPVQWLWLLHDDCAPDPDALTELLRVVDNDPHAVIVGPKLRGWYDRKQLLEVGVSIANSGRRWTGLDRREQDQGQHDQVRSVLSVSTAGMLIRRDVWEELGGFDRRLPLMRDDVDLCWRAHAAGHSVVVAPDAVLRHAEASARERRPIDCVGRSVASPHRVDKAGAVYTLLVNTRGRGVPYVLLRLVFGTLLRVIAYLVGKAPGQALDEVAGLVGTLLRPERILAARRARGTGTVEAGELRPLFPPPGATVKATAEQVVGHFGGSSDVEAGSRHGAVESGPGGDDADFLEIEQFARLKRIARKPAPVLFAVLLLVSLIACRALLGGGALAGGALLPAPDHVSELWNRYADVWHPLGTGGTQTAPPYLGVLAVFSTVLLGHTGLALTLLLVCSVPLAGLTAYFASRPLTGSRLLRAWGSIAYAFLPAATGALAGGRVGTAVLAVLLPLIARCAVAASGVRGERGSWRAVWAYAFLLTLTMAFTPVVWPLAVVIGIAVLALHRDEITAYGLRFLALAGTPLVLLAPWSLSLLTGPSGFFREAGMEFGKGSASALDLLGMSPGGPETAGGVLLIGVVLAALAALLRGERQFAIRGAWAVALLGLVFSVLANRSGWAGPTTLVYGIALLVAAVLGAEGARGRVATQSFGWRQPVAGLIAIAALLAPVVAAFSWMVSGADGPLERRDPVQVPAFVAEESGTRDQARTLILGGTSPGEVSYTLVRGSGGRLGDAELARAGGSSPRLDKIVSRLVAGSGADQSSQLSGYAIRYLLVRDGAPREMSRVLDATPGLSRLSQLDGSELWRVDRQVARATIVSGTSSDAATDEGRSVAAGPVDIHTTVPAGKSGRVLRLADSADPGWQATLDGHALTRTTVDGWAQGFELPTQGGTLDVSYDEPLTHTLWVWVQVLLAIVLLVLALPGRRVRIDDDLPDEELPVPAEPVAGEGRRARRLRAAAQAEAEAAGAMDAPDGTGPAGADIPGAPGSQDTAADVPGEGPGDLGDPGGPGEQGPYAPAAGPADPGADPAADAAVPADGGFAPQYGTEIPQQPAYGEWEQSAYTTGDYSPYPAGQYGGNEGQYGEGQYGNEGPYAPGQYGQGAPYGTEGQYAEGQYAEGQYPEGRQQYDPYQQHPDGQYDPYGYVQPPHQPPYPDENEHRPDGSNQ